MLNIACFAKHAGKIQHDRGKLFTLSRGLKEMCYVLCIKE